MSGNIHSRAQRGNVAKPITPPSRVTSNFSAYGSSSDEVEAIALRLLEGKPKAEAKLPKPVTIRKFSWEV